MNFFKSKLAVYVAPSSAQAFFRRIFTDFQPEHSGFHSLLQTLEKGDKLHVTTDGSVLDDGEASSGWHFWWISYEDEDDKDSKNNDNTNNDDNDVDDNDDSTDNDDV